MENVDKEILNEVINNLEKLTQRVVLLEREVAVLKGEALPGNTDIDEIDDDIPVDIIDALGPEMDFPETAQEDTVQEDEIEEAVAQDEIADEPAEEIADEPAEDMPYDLFGSESVSAVDVKKKTPRSINEAIAATSTAVIDAMAESAAWKRDLPGPEVKDIRSAIALIDRVLFISTLFRSDSLLYQETIQNLNTMKNLDEAESYLFSNFPEWKVDSDNVYRFMMAVRRKIR